MDAFIQNVQSMGAYILTVGRTNKTLTLAVLIPLGTSTNWATQDTEQTVRCWTVLIQSNVILPCSR